MAKVIGVNFWYF